MRYADMSSEQLGNVLDGKRRYLTFLKSKGKKEHGSKNPNRWPAELRDEVQRQKDDCKRIQTLLGAA